MKSGDPLFEKIRKGLEDGCELSDLEKRLWDEHGETCAVLTLDSTGFTRTTRKHGIAYFLSIISGLRRAGVETFERHGVLHWRAFADNLFAEFPTVDQALAAALEMHEHYASHPPPRAAKSHFGVCIGIGYGRMLRSQQDGMYGDEMNLAAKLGEDVAELGETLLTPAAWDALGSHNGLRAEPRSTVISTLDIPHYAIWPA